MKNKNLVAILLLLVANSSFAGGEGHGGNHVKDNILWAQRLSRKIMRSPTCFAMLGIDNCAKLEQKLSVDIQWHEGLAPDGKTVIPLKAMLDGSEIIVTFKTDADLISPIVADVYKAAPLTVTGDITMMWHEVGHYLKISDNLTMDKLLLRAVDEDISLRTTLVLAQSVPVPDENRMEPVPLMAPVPVVLAQVLNNGEKNNGSYAAEKSVLVDGVEWVLAAIDKTANDYLSATLDAGLTDIGIYENSEDQVQLLRLDIQNAIDDAKFIASPAASDSAALANYAKRILVNGLIAGYHSPSITREFLLETRGVQRALLLLETLPSGNDKFRQSLRSILADDNNLFNPDEKNRVYFLRDAIRKVVQ